MELQVGPSVTTLMTGAALAVAIPALRVIDRVAAADIEAVALTSQYVSVTAHFIGYHVGDVVLVAGFVAPANNGRYRVIAVDPGGLSITVAIVPGTPLVDEAAGPAVTFDRLRLPNYVRLLINAPAGADTTARPFSYAGSVPAAAVNMLLPLASAVIVNVLGCEWMALEGAGGDVCMTSLENG